MPVSRLKLLIKGLDALVWGFTQILHRSFGPFNHLSWITDKTVSTILPYKWTTTCPNWILNQCWESNRFNVQICQGEILPHQTSGPQPMLSLLRLWPNNWLRCKALLNVYMVWKKVLYKYSIVIIYYYYYYYEDDYSCSCFLGNQIMVWAYTCSIKYTNLPIKVWACTFIDSTIVILHM